MERFEEFGFGEAGAVAGDGFEFIERAAGGMLVDFSARDAGGINDAAGFHHGDGEVSGFEGGHALEIDGHGESSHLVVRDGAGGVTSDEGADFSAVEFAAVAFLFYDPLRSHGL